MLNFQELPILDHILAQYRPVLGKHFTGYRHHCYRAFYACQAISTSLAQPLSAQDKHKLQIAFAFHDLGLFTDNTVDYLPPSVALARDYLMKQGLNDWQDEISLMISEHHKITRYTETSATPAALSLIELVRQGDLVDFSLGVIRFGLDKSIIKQLKQQYPNAGFHQLVIKKQCQRFISHPLRPFPIFKW